MLSVEGSRCYCASSTGPGQPAGRTGTHRERRATLTSPGMAWLVGNFIPNVLVEHVVRIAGVVVAVVVCIRRHLVEF